MNKLVGYIEIDVYGQIIPIKMGSYALQNFCTAMGIEVDEIATLVEFRERDGKMVPVVKNMFKFASVVLWSGADYASKATGGSGYPDPIVAYEWIDSLGGITSPMISKVSDMFWSSVYVPQKPEKISKSSKKKAEATDV